MNDNPYNNSQGGFGQQTVGFGGAGGSGAAPRAGQPAAGGLEGFGQPAGSAAGDLIKDTTTANFTADVIQESRHQPVLVDFWAPWCGPCKQLTPILEKAVQAAAGSVKLVKMNIDQHPSIAGQLGVQSIPAVFAFVNGQPVDGFMGALPESEVKAFIGRLTAGQPGGDPIGEALQEASALLDAGDAGSAAQIFGAILQHEPGHPAATAGLAECYLKTGDSERAKALIDQVPADKAEDPALTAVVAKLKLMEEIAELGDPVQLQARLDANADDHRARFDLALIANARGERQIAADQLLEIMRRDRSFDDDAARLKLLDLFAAWGAADPATKEARRKLSSLLFS
ncbi:thioredoxin [Jiella sp. MQZ9-1]|uniref:Thioredoxin n=1 Tax=Jiella flava TaxID=2816857 RepID=A0A939FYC3_9HYPH|nr:thioredoxin [Jiella flava]MBO0661619.1 thioredoxin [Jiella flava]MCD2470261.1 thioredoxin [Jiella flava]